MWGDRSAGTQGKRSHANVRPRFTPIQDTMASDIGIPIITMGRDRGMADKGWRSTVLYSSADVKTMMLQSLHSYSRNTLSSITLYLPKI